MSLPYKPAKAHGGPLKPTVVTIHCTESDNNTGTAESLAGPNWFGGPAGTSAHKIFDRNSGVEMVRRNVVAYHAGPKGNVIGVSYELCGRASWSKAKWREPEQLQMLKLAAPYIADDLKSMGAPARWLSLAQLAAKAKGMCTHNDIRLALGGTTHSDPGPNFPYAELLAYVQAALNPPAKTEEFLMALTDAQQKDLYAKITEVHHESTLRLPSREDSKPRGSDTVLGYAANADAFGYRIEKKVADLDAKLNAILAALGNTAPATDPI